MAGLFVGSLVLIIAMGLAWKADRDLLSQENEWLRDQIAKFDGDGDGRIGGSKKRT